MTYQEDFRQALGEAVTFDPEILRAYDHDLGEMPWALMALIDHRPRLVVAARTVNDVTTALVLAARHGIPVTPRGQATSGYGGAIPCKGGMVLDLSNLNRVLGVDAEKGTADVEPGVVWEELSRTLAGYGLDNRVCPTSAPSSTAGGWFSMGGVGIGSLCYGSIRDNVLEIDVAGLDGGIRTLAGPDIEPYYQTCGALGVVTRLRLSCRTAEPVRHMAVRLPDVESAARFLSRAELDLSPYSASLQSDGYCAMRAAAEEHEPVVSSGFLACLALQGELVDIGAANNLALAHGGSVLPEKTAVAEWNDRYYPMRIKKLGPAVLVGEFSISLGGFAACWRDIVAAMPNDQLGLEAFSVRGGRLAVLTYILDDAGTLLFPLRMGKAMIPIRIAVRHGGSVYATGMWFNAMARDLFGPEKHEAVRRLKSVLDGCGLLNPGTLDGPGLPFLPFVSLSRCILAGTACIAPLSARLSSRRRIIT